jgi:hypothetical protein
MHRGRYLLAALVAIALVLPQGAAAQTPACPHLPTTLNPKNSGYRFTMLIRINQMENVEAYVNSDEATGGLARRIRPQDIFVINTRFQDPAGSSNPAVAAQLVAKLRASFPCNRIIALNGLGSDPTRPGYVYALADQGLFAVMLDWEAEDWNFSRFFNPGMPRWDYHFRPSTRRIAGWSRNLSVALGRLSPHTRTGLATLDNRGWDYGRVAQILDRRNRRIGRRHLSPQSVQTQTACMQGPKTFGRRAGAIKQSYRFKISVKKRMKHGKRRLVHVKHLRKKRSRPNARNLALQVSFSDSPSPGDPLPVRNVAPITADRCILRGLHHGIGAFFLFASDSSMRSLFQQPTVSRLRPPL